MYNSKPVISAIIHPIGIEHHIAITPKGVVLAKEYDSKTLKPKETIVKIKEISGLLIPLKYPYHKKRIPILFSNI